MRLGQDTTIPKALIHLSDLLNRDVASCPYFATLAEQPPIPCGQSPMSRYARVLWHCSRRGDSWSRHRFV